jgi:hypothetical protein
MKCKAAILLVLALAAGVQPACAAKTGDLGFGAMLGSPMGVTAKYWWNELVAFDGGIGYGNAGVFYADVLFNSWTLVPQRFKSPVNIYFGAGPRVATDDGGQFAVRAMAGAGYWPKNAPVELFAEVGPTFKVTPDSEVGIDGGVGFRYYFSVTLSRIKGSPR